MTFMNPDRRGKITMTTFCRYCQVVKPGDNNYLATCYECARAGRVHKPDCNLHKSWVRPHTGWICDCGLLPKK